LHDSVGATFFNQPGVEQEPSLKQQRVDLCASHLLQKLQELEQLKYGTKDEIEVLSFQLATSWLEI